MANAQGTPESDFSIECFQNYTAPEVFIQGLAGIVNQKDVETMIRAQKQMLQRFEKTNEMLTNCNALSASRLKTVGPELKKHTQLLADMKKDLDYIFKKIRVIKTKLSTQYPQEFAEAQRNSLAEEADELDQTENPKSPNNEQILDKNSEKTDQNSGKNIEQNIGKNLQNAENPDLDKNLEGLDISDEKVGSSEVSDKRKSYKSNKSSSTDSNNDFSCSDTESP